MHWRKDFNQLILLAAPMVLGQLSMVGMHITDAAMIGRVGVHELAAASFGGSVLLMFLLFGNGLCMPVHYFASQAFGAGDKRKAWEWTQYTILFVILYGLLISLLFTFGADLLGYMGQDPTVASMAQTYSIYLAWSLLPTFMAQCLKKYSESMGNVWYPFWVLASAFFLNILLNWIFIYGNLGAPAMGLEGAGVATVCSRIFSLVLLIVFLWRGGLVMRWGQFFKNMERSYVFGVAKKGIPNGFQTLFQAGAFIFATVIIGWMGPIPQAAYQMTQIYAALVFMVPLGISFATTILVGREMGRLNYDNLYRIGRNNLTYATLFMVAISFMTYFGRDLIPLIFVDPSLPNGDLVVKTASVFLVVVSLGHAFDGAWSVASAALRGMGVVQSPVYILFFSFWVIALPLGCLLAFYFKIGPVGIWWGLLSGLTCAGVLMVWRFVVVVRRCQMS